MPPAAAIHRWPKTHLLATVLAAIASSNNAALEST